VSCLDPLEIDFDSLAFFSDITLLLPTSPLPNPASYTRTCLIQPTRHSMCLHRLPGRKYCLKPCSSECWAYWGVGNRFIHLCDDCVNKLTSHTRFDIHQHPHYAPYSNPKVQPSATTLGYVWNTRVFLMALTALAVPRTLWRRMTRFLSPRQGVALHSRASGRAGDKPGSVWEHLESQ